MRVLLAGLLFVCLGAVSAASAADGRKVVETYANIAEAAYEDSLMTAKNLQSKVRDLVVKPSPETLAAARRAWIAARVPYQQTEVYRFGNAIVDD